MQRFFLNFLLDGRNIHTVLCIETSEHVFLQRNPQEKSMSASMAISTFIDILRFWSSMTSERGGGAGGGERGYGCDKAVSYTPPPPPTIKDGKMARFWPSRGFILDLAEGGSGLLFNFILSKIVSNLNVFEPLLTPKICYPKTDS